VKRCCSKATRTQGSQDNNKKQDLAQCNSSESPDISGETDMLKPYFLDTQPRFGGVFNSMKSVRILYAFDNQAGELASCTHITY